MLKRDGFINEIMIVVPPELYMKPDRVCQQFYITSIGYFPRAAGHYVERDEGTDSNIMIICTDGSGWIETAGSKHEIKSGEALIIPAQLAHKYGSTAGGWWQIYWIHYRGESASEISRKISGSKKAEPFQLTPGSESRQLFSQICSDLIGGISPLNYDLACGRLWNLAASLNRDRSLGAPTGRGIIKDCLKLMEERINTGLSLEDLSCSVSVTPQYLCRLFKKTTGRSPIEHFSRMKIQRACTLLDMTEQRINEIARQLGYDDPYYFTRTFKRIMGTSPRGYRNRQQ